MNDSPLQVALAASKPLPASNAEECRELLEVERLIPAHKRRITVDDHARFRETLDDPRADDADLEDLIRELRHPREPYLCPVTHRKRK